MGRVHEVLDERLKAWLEGQPVFFVATAPIGPGGHVNCSPKGNRDEFVVLGPHRVAYADQTGSGVETLAHLRENGRIVLMFCAFQGPPRIVRLHGSAVPVMPGDDGFAELLSVFGARPLGVRSIMDVAVTRISDSCGFGVPLLSFEGHRPTMDEWADRKGEEGILRYWAERNSTSIDGLPGVPDASVPAS